MIELQACHRINAPPPRDQDRERMLVLPLVFALHNHGCGGSWTPVRLSINPCYSSMCIDALESTTNVRSSGFSTRVLVLPKHRWESRTWPCPLLRAYRHFCQIPMLLCERIVLVAKFPGVFYPQILTRIALVKFTLLQNTWRWSLSFPIFCDAVCPWRI